MKPALAERQREAEFRAATDAPGGQPTGPGDPAGSREPVGPTDPTIAPDPKLQKTRFFAATRIDAESAPAAVIQINNEILKHLIGDTGTHVRVRIEIEAERPAGFDDVSVRTLSENADALRFEDVSFEE